MGPDDIEQWARDFYPVFDRQGLIIDVRHNHGGNIDSWLLGKLLRKAWFYWQPRVGNPSSNMQYAFRGHIVVLCDQANRFRRRSVCRRLSPPRIGQGHRHAHLGRRDLAFSEQHAEADGRDRHGRGDRRLRPRRQMADRGHGVDPDIVVDNLPHATFGGAMRN